MSKKIRIVLAQLNLTVGDIAGNLEKHIQAAHEARDKHAAELIIFPELGLIGYPCEDLLLRTSFIDAATAALHRFINEVKGIYCLVGHPHTENHNCLFNSCSLVYNGSIVGRYDKQRLPNYGVFDECRYFTPGEQNCILPIDGLSAGLLICEDLWKIDPARDVSRQGAQIILAPNASPFEYNKHEQRLAVLGKRAEQHGIPIVYVNQVCGQDELIFDGGSLVVDAEGKLCQFAGFFNETLLPVDLTLEPTPQIAAADISIIPQEERIYEALVLGVRDYINKNHFKGVLVGVSGGIDSALTLAIAVDALGSERVHAVMMPSRYTASISMEDAQELISHLGVSSEIIPIESVYGSFLDTLSQSFADTAQDITEENIQARCRAVILMALSNKYGHLVLTTGNRSEIAVGYCTLYGDMAGGYAVLKDIPKTLVYKLAAFRNQRHPVIPARTIERPPSAELAPDQKDEDTLPAYAILDQILECYLNESLSPEDIIARGFDSDMVYKIMKMIKHSEYKRKQAAIGPRVNHKSFGKDWRYPVTNGFKG